VPLDRLAFAHWLVDRRNPLTARVQVNRLWARVFGTGIVATEEDFGTQGGRPTHPELLDWLAMELMDNGWSLRHVLRTMLCSATYRRSAVARPTAVELDPQNRWLSRGPRFRLEAEMVRDQALAFAGLLSGGGTALRCSRRSPTGSGRPRSTASGPGGPAPARSGIVAASTRSCGARARIRP
jgi:hypothetical protein